jgi:hypothetical protein
MVYTFFGKKRSWEIIREDNWEIMENMTCVVTRAHSYKERCLYACRKQEASSKRISSLFPTQCCSVHVIFSDKLVGEMCWQCVIDVKEEVIKMNSGKTKVYPMKFLCVYVGHININMGRKINKVKLIENIIGSFVWSWSFVGLFLG